MVRLVAYEHQPGNGHHLPCRGHHGHVAVLLFGDPPEEHARRAGILIKMLGGFDEHPPRVTIALQNARLGRQEWIIAARKKIGVLSTAFGWAAFVVGALVWLAFALVAWSALSGAIPYVPGTRPVLLGRIVSIRPGRSDPGGNHPGGSIDISVTSERNRARVEEMRLSTHPAGALRLQGLLAVGKSLPYLDSGSHDIAVPQKVHQIMGISFLGSLVLCCFLSIGGMAQKSIGFKWPDTSNGGATISYGVWINGSENAVTGKFPWKLMLFFLGYFCFMGLFLAIDLEMSASTWTDLSGLRIWTVCVFCLLAFSGANVVYLASRRL